MKAFGFVFYQNFKNDPASQVAVAFPETPIRNFCVYLAPFARQILSFSASWQTLETGKNKGHVKIKGFTVEPNYLFFIERTSFYKI